MDGKAVNLPNQNQTLSKQPSLDVSSQNNKKKIGISGTVFIGIVALILSLGILNYFNILTLSSLFPSQPTKQSNNVKIPTTTAPTSSLAKQAKETLITFLPTILKPSLLPQPPSDINMTDKSINQTISGSWDLKDGRAITILTVSPDSREISQLLFFFPYATTESVSIGSAQSTVPKLFSITPKGEWGCKTIPNTANYCENFWEERSGVRRGIALKESTLSQAKKITVSFCEHNKNSRLYSWKSCAPEFAKTGVQ